MPSRAAAARVTRGIRSNAWSVTAAALIALSAVEIAQGKWDVLPQLGRVAFVALVLGPLPLIRSMPVVATTTMMVAGDVLLLVFGAPRSLALFFVVWLAAFAAAAYGPQRWQGRTTLIALIASLVVVTDVRGDGGWAWSDFVFSCMLFTFSVVLGLAFGGHVRRSARAEEATRRAHEREATAALRAASLERARIARDLHDIVAHGVSLMVVQAAAATNVLDHDRDQARTALGAIEATGQRTLGELRRMLDVMREDTEQASLPQPGLASLASLAAEAQQAGTPVAVTLDLAGRQVPPGVDVTAYRIIQEALTNARRHAPGAATRVAVAVVGDELRLEIVDDGGRASAPASGSAGHGLDGMRERAGLYGGRVDAGPIGGGWRVSCCLKLDPSPDPTGAAGQPAGAELAVARRTAP